MMLKFKPEEKNIRVFEKLTGLECVVNNFYEYESDSLPRWLKTKVEYECSSCKKTHLINFRGFIINLEKNSKFICKSCITIVINKIINRKGVKHKKDKVDYKKVIYDKFGIILLDDVIRYRDYANFICDKHGEKNILLKNIIRTGCVECNNMKLIDIKLDKFIKKSIKMHNGKYDYSKVKYDGVHNNVIIICDKHGEFEQTPLNHTHYSGCPMCKESKGETVIREILINNGIEFTSQYKFNECKNKLPLPFDFYLPELNICIEYNGIQHYEPVEYFGGDKAFEYRKKNDKIKADYCNNNGIELLIISYNDNVEDKLNELLNNL